MKRTILAAAVLALPLAVAAAPETYVIDPIHSYSHFGVSHFGFATIWGRFDKSTGTFTLDKAAKSASLDVTIEAATITTGDNDKGSRPRSRDEHLRGADFFNVTEFPRMTYKASAVKFAGDAPATVEGQFTMLGVTKPLTLTVSHWRCGSHPFNKREMCGGDAQGVLKRSDFGMKFGLPAISDEVRLFIGFEAYKQ